MRGFGQLVIILFAELQHVIPKVRKRIVAYIKFRDNPNIEGSAILRPFEGISKGVLGEQRSIEIGAK
jgi:hypothetical protein